MDPAHGLTPINVKTDQVTFKRQQAVRVTDTAPARTGDEGRLAILTDQEFQSGTIEVDLAGEVSPGAAEGARGFVGIAFRVAPDGTRFECIYLRPTNGQVFLGRACAGSFPISTRPTWISLPRMDQGEDRGARGQGAPVRP